MATSSIPVVPTATGWVRGFWAFYRRYTATAVHTAATAALAIFGILVFVDPWFAALAIACYVVPPVVLYVLADSPAPEDAHPGERDPEGAHGTQRASPSEPELSEVQAASSGDDRGSRTTVGAGFDGVDGDTDSDGAGGETEADGDDGDTDTDRRGTDVDADRDDGDTDSDSDDGDTDSDSDDGDTDSDSDDGDTDSDSDDGDTDSDSDDGDTDSDSDS